jgi:hypothetical protein
VFFLERAKFGISLEYLSVQRVAYTRRKIPDQLLPMSGDWPTNLFRVLLCRPNSYIQKYCPMKVLVEIEENGKHPLWK